MCGHMCMCYECAIQQWRGKGGGHCPLCRAVIRDVIRTYTSWSAFADSPDGSCNNYVLLFLQPDLVMYFLKLDFSSSLPLYLISAIYYVFYISKLDVYFTYFIFMFIPLAENCTNTLRDIIKFTIFITGNNPCFTSMCNCACKSDQTCDQQKYFYKFLEFYIFIVMVYQLSLI